MKTVRAFPALIASLSLAACVGSGGDPHRDAVAGIYYLVAVDDSAVPATVYHDGHALQVFSGVIIIGGDGTCFSRTRFGEPGEAAMTREVHARYRIEDSRLIMQWEGAGTTAGTVEGDTFVMDNHGMIFEYERSG